MRTDVNGFVVKVTALGKNKGVFGVRVLRDGNVVAQGRAASKVEVRIVVKALLRWVDKAGFDSPMASASRDRGVPVGTEKVKITWA